MGNCKELLFDDIVRVYPLSKGTLKHLVPDTVRKDVVLINEIQQGDGTAFASLDALHTWLGTKARFTQWETDEVLPLVLDQPAQVRLSREYDINGYTYAITVTLELKKYESTEKAIVRQIERTGHDLIVEREDGTLELLRLFDPAQKITSEQSERDGQHGATVTIKMKNVNGMQEITQN